MKDKTNILEREKKNRKIMRDREETSKNERDKSSDTYTDVSNRVFIIGDTILKHVRDQKLWFKVKT